MMHLQVVLGAGLAVLCFCLIVGCALCWRKGKRRDKEQALERIVLDSSSGLLGHAGTPVKQQYEEVEGSVLDYPSCPTAGGSGLGRQGRPGPHGRASLPFIPTVQRVGNTRSILERRCTVSAVGTYYKDATADADALRPPPAVSDMKTKARPLLHFTLCYSSHEMALMVGVISLHNLPKRFGSGCDSYVRVRLHPKAMETQQTAVRRKSLNPEFRESFQFSGCTLEEVKCLKLRFAAYVKEFHNLKDTFVGELLFPLEQGDWTLDTPSEYTRELTSTRSKLKKCLSSQDLVSPTGGPAHPKPVGQLFILLQYQTLANRIKVMVRKAEGLGRLTRIPGSPDHSVIINLYKDGKVMSSKETKASSGYNPVWNAPFLFDIPSGDIESLVLSLEFIVMQGRIYTRSCVLGRVLIGADAPETGRMHWKEMCSRGHVETARWHAIQSDAL
ncbi:synaptotagmin-11 isoform X2 [Rhinoraja longicauda]